MLQSSEHFAHVKIDESLEVQIIWLFKVNIFAILLLTYSGVPILFVFFEHSDFAFFNSMLNYHKMVIFGKFWADLGIICIFIVYFVFCPLLIFGHDLHSTTQSHDSLLQKQTRSAHYL